MGICDVVQGAFAAARLVEGVVRRDGGVEELVVEGGEGGVGGDVEDGGERLVAVGDEGLVGGRRGWRRGFRRRGRCWQRARGALARGRRRRLGAFAAARQQIARCCHMTKQVGRIRDSLRALKANHHPALRLATPEAPPASHGYLRGEPSRAACTAQLLHLLLHIILHPAAAVCALLADCCCCQQLSARHAHRTAARVNDKPVGAA